MISSFTPTASTKCIRALKKELRRKDKALAEMAALLVLQEKLSALRDNEEDD